MMTVRFTFSDLTLDVDDPSQNWEWLLRVTANFSVLIDENAVFNEPHFPILEFAARLGPWLRGPQGSFRYTSMDAAVDPLITFGDAGSGMFAISSPWASSVGRLVAQSELVEAGRQFFEMIERQVEIPERVALDILGGH